MLMEPSLEPVRTSHIHIVRGNEGDALCPLCGKIWYSSRNSGGLVSVSLPYSVISEDEGSPFKRILGNFIREGTGEATLHATRSETHSAGSQGSLLQHAWHRLF